MQFISFDKTSTFVLNPFHQDICNHLLVSTMIKKGIYLMNAHGAAGRLVSDAVWGPHECGDGATCTRHRYSSTWRFALTGSTM